LPDYAPLSKKSQSNIKRLLVEPFARVGGLSDIPQAESPNAPTAQNGSASASAGTRE
jgi:hypothetical protein